MIEPPPQATPGEAEIGRDREGGMAKPNGEAEIGRDREGGMAKPDGEAEIGRDREGGMAKPTRPASQPLVDGVRAICMALPEVAERPSHGAPTWFVQGKKTFVQLWDGGHHQDDFPHLWCAAPPGVQGELVEAEPERFFRPPYVGGRGWIGVRLDVDLDWDEIAGICRDAYRTVAPARLVAEVSEPGT